MKDLNTLVESLNGLNSPTLFSKRLQGVLADQQEWSIRLSEMIGAFDTRADLLGITNPREIVKTEEQVEYDFEDIILELSRTRDQLIEKACSDYNRAYETAVYDYITAYNKSV